MKLFSTFILLFTLLCTNSFATIKDGQKDLSHCRYAFLFAMPEEAKALQALNIPLQWRNHLGYSIADFNYKNHQCRAIITGVGKALSAGAAAIALESFKPDAIINVGSAGGINAHVGDVILSQSAIFHDVNMSSIHLPLNKLPDLPIIIKSKHDLISVLNLKDKLPKDIALRSGIIISGDQFMHRAEYVKNEGIRYPQAHAIEMEAASIASICYRAGVDYLFVKKISNCADVNSDDRFSTEIQTFKDKSGEVVKAILEN